MTPRNRMIATAVIGSGALLSGVLWLNNLALRNDWSPSDAKTWFFIWILLTVVLTFVLAIRAQHAGLRARDAALTTIVCSGAWWLIFQVVPHPGEERSVTVGDRGRGPGAGMTHDVGNKYKRPELEQTLASLQRIPASSYAAFSCGDQPPQFRWELTLVPAAEYQDRQVDVGYIPNVDNANQDRCLSFGVSFLVDSVFAEIDTGPRVDYGYKDPMTGKRLPPYDFGPPRRPICRCDLRYGRGEWVAWSQEAADSLK